MKHLPTNPSKAFKNLNPHLFGITQPESTGTNLLRQSAKPLMNQLEREFMVDLITNGYKHISAQTVRFRIGNGVTYTPDFMCTDPFSMSTLLFEVKGKYVWDDAKVKIKVAAAMYPWMIWRVAWKKDGQWRYQVVLP